MTRRDRARLDAACRAIDAQRLHDVRLMGWRHWRKVPPSVRFTHTKGDAMLWHHDTQIPRITFRESLIGWVGLLSTLFAVSIALIGAYLIGTAINP